MWLLQHWLNSTFKYQLAYPMSEHIMCLNQNRRIKGVRLALITCQETPNRHLFMKYINMFIEATSFIPGMSPFMDRNFGPTWFKNPFPGDPPQAAALSSAMWRAFLTPTMLSFRIKVGSKGYGFMNYQPNLVAWQFGLSQMLPKSLVSQPTDIMWAGRQLNFEGHKACLKFQRSTQRLELPIFKYQQSFLTTKDFDKWWSECQCKYIPNVFFLQNLIDPFPPLLAKHQLHCRILTLPSRKSKLLMSMRPNQRR